MRQFINLLVLAMLLLPTHLWAQNIVAAEYYIDTDAGFGQNVAIPLDQTGENIEQTFTVDFTGLDFGSHTLGIRAKDAKGKWSLVSSRAFLVVETPPTGDEIVAAEYFVNTDAGLGQNTPIALSGVGEDISMSFSVPLTGYEPGIHMLYVRAMNGNRHWSITTHMPFVVVDSTELTNIVALEYYYYDPDEETIAGADLYTHRFPTPNASIDEAFQADVSALTSGKDYSLYVWAVNEAGRRSLVSTTQFLYCDNTDGGCTAPLAIDKLVVTNIGCDGGNFGQVKILAAEGKRPYSYSLSGEDDSYGTDSTFSDLVAGTYTAYVKDSKGTVVSKEFTISRATPLSVDLDVGNANCSPEPNGLIDVRVSGAAPGSVYTYSLNGGEFQTESLFEGLETGDYTIIVRSDGSCDATATATVQLQDDEVFTPQIFASDDAAYIGTLSLEANVPDDTESLQWYLNSEPVEGATEKVLTIEKGGSYRVDIQIGWCTFSSEEFTVTDTEETITQEMKVYPNPAQATLTAEVPSGLIHGEVIAQLISSQGQLIQQQRLQPQGGVRSSTFDTGSLPTGLYVITLRGTDFFIRYKITKQ